MERKKGHSECNTIDLNIDNNTFAHSLENRPLAEWQLLGAHLAEVARMSAIFADQFNSADWAWNAGLLHDFGKAADEFQAYLRRENHLDDSAYDLPGGSRINHSSAGAALAEELLNQEQLLFGRILSYLIAGHHAGLPDYYSCDGGRGALQIRLEEGAENLERLRHVAVGLTSATSPLLNLPAYVNVVNFHFWVRMLFSCLVDADFLDTAAFMNPVQEKHRVGTDSLGKLKLSLDRFMANLKGRCENTPVNRIRDEILTACRSAASHSPGLFTLTVPTGGGKTLSAMSFALEHAMIYNKWRIIYVIPYTSIIEQTAATLESIFGPANVVEHHSNLDPEKETLRTRLASENWDAPIIVTTNVQFFESLFAARSSRCRKIHNLVNSVVILDEAQLVPPNKLAPCVSAINELTRNYGVTLILSTATQPALPELDKPTEIIPAELKLYEQLHRTEINTPSDLLTSTSWEELAGQLLEHEQVLCIVNTRRNCYDLFQLMPPGTIHLSALMCGEHRSKVIGSIKTRLKAGEPLRVISTQLVEAGVDIDFPVVYRALAGLDSIAQAAGRCNREGLLEFKGEVNVFCPPQTAPPGILHKGESTTRELLALSGIEPQKPELFAHYFDLFYSKLNDTGNGFLIRLKPSDPKILDVAFRSVGDEFKLIDEQTQRPILVRYCKGESLIHELRQLGPSRQLLRKLQRYTVNVSHHIANKMLESGFLEEPREGFLAQTYPSLYDDTIGLDVFRNKSPLEDMII